jgi:hypothetical protein
VCWYVVNSRLRSTLLLTIVTEKWERPPNFLIVDFYNQGPTSGSVFEAAAQANGVTYNRPCCGTTVRSLAVANVQAYTVYLGLLIAMMGLMMI